MQRTPHGNVSLPASTRRSYGVICRRYLSLCFALRSNEARNGMLSRYCSCCACSFRFASVDRVTKLTRMSFLGSDSDSGQRSESFRGDGRATDRELRANTHPRNRHIIYVRTEVMGFALRTSVRVTIGSGRRALSVRSLSRLFLLFFPPREAK